MACASCHGMDGTGNSQSMVAFEVPLPDFSDCNFTSREPAADWVGISAKGGPIRGFDRLMPAFGEALSDKQLEAVVTHVKGFCDEERWPDGEMNLPKPLVTAKAYPEDEYLIRLGTTVGEPVNVSGKILAEKRIGARHQVEVAVPFGVKEIAETDEKGVTDYRWGEGIGDVALGYKVAFFHSRRTKSIASFATEVLLPTGDEEDQLGTGIVRIEPFLAASQIIGENGFTHLQLGAVLSTDTSESEHELFWRGAVGRMFTQGEFGRTWSPMIEVLGARTLEDGADTEWDILPQMQVTLNQRQHIMFCAGTRVPLTDYDKDSIEVIAYLLWDWFDGGFTEGW